MERILPQARRHPRMSVTKLGEYLTANATRRRRIIHDQREPQDFITTRYRPARDFLRKYFTLVAPDRDAIQEEITRLRRRKPSTTGEADRLRDSADALEAFLRLPEGFEDRLTKTTLPVSGFGPHQVSGVAVSVNPDLQFTPEAKKGVAYAGAVKIYIGKKNALSERAAEAVAVLVQRDLSLRHPESVVIRPRDCLVLDLFAGIVTAAPARSTRLIREIEIACGEIVDRWHS
jgi:hypothetical protein